MPFVGTSYASNVYTEQADPVEGCYIISILACSLGFHAITLERSSFLKSAKFKIKPV